LEIIIGDEHISFTVENPAIDKVDVENWFFSRCTREQRPRRLENLLLFDSRFEMFGLFFDFLAF
jgi:hypothetical protein